MIDDYIAEGLRLASFELDFTFPLKKYPEHISMVMICPKKAKRKGNHVVVHVRFEHLGIPAGLATPAEEQRIAESHLKLEVEPLLAEVFGSVIHYRR
jgi:hypothetical protein